MSTPTTWRTFVAESRSFFDSNRGSPIFCLIEEIDRLYSAVHATAPFPKAGVDEKTDLLRMCFLICHRALISAATNAGSGLPEDSSAITRRALEGAKVSLAIKFDPSNFEIWKAAEVRIKRWNLRSANNMPKPLTVKFKGVQNQPLYQELQTGIGILSDVAVHFTPEHLIGYEWEQSENPNGTTDIGFGVSESAVATELLSIATYHRLILRTFDYCLDQRLYCDARVQTLTQNIFRQYKALLEQEGMIESTTPLGDSWQI